MPEGRGALSGVFFIRPGKFLPPTPGLESSRHTSADVNVNGMRSHDGVAPTLTLGQQTDVNNYRDAGRATESCTRGADGGRQHECSSRIKTLQEVCSRFENENERLRRQAVDQELAKKRHYLQILQLQHRMKELETELAQLREEGVATGRPPSAASLNMPPELTAFKSSESFAPSSASSIDSYSNIRPERQHFTDREWTYSTRHGTSASRTSDSHAWHGAAKIKSLPFLPRRGSASASDASDGEMENSLVTSPDRHGCASTVARPVHIAQPGDASNVLCTTRQEIIMLDPATRGDATSSPDVRRVVARKDTTTHACHKQQEVQEKHLRSAGTAVVEPVQFESEQNGCLEVDSRKDVATPGLHSADDRVSATTQSATPRPKRITVTSERPADTASSRANCHSLRDFWTGDISREVISVTPDTTDCAEDAGIPVADGAQRQDDVSEDVRREWHGQREASHLNGVKQFQNPAVSETRPGTTLSPLREVRGEKRPDGDEDILPAETSSTNSDVAPTVSKPGHSDDVTRPRHCSSRTEVEAISKGQAYAYDATSAPKEAGGKTRIIPDRQQAILAVQPARAEASNAMGGRTDDFDVGPNVPPKDATMQAFHKPQVQGKHRCFAGAAVVEPGQLESDPKGCAEVKHGKGYVTPELHAVDDSVSATTRPVTPCPTSSTVSSERSTNAATSRAPVHSLRDFWTGDTCRVFISVTPATANCSADAGMPVVDGAHGENDVSDEGRRKWRAQRDASDVTRVKHVGDPETSTDRDTRPRSILSPLRESRGEKQPGGDGQDVRPPETCSVDSDVAHTASKPLQGASPDSAPPVVKATSKGQASAHDASFASKEAGEETTFTHTHRQPTSILAVRPAVAEAPNAMGVSTHVMICSYCNAPPPSDAPVAMCKGCPRRLCVDCLRNDIQGATHNGGGGDHRTRALLEGQSGDLFVEECPWCIRESDLEFAPPPDGKPPMKHLLQELLRHDLSYCFREPVNVEVHPDYLETIGRKSMMDLGTMMTKLENQKYPRRRGPGQFVEDLCKIWRNCRKFAGCNELGQPVHGTSVPGIVRCALILEAMSTRYVQSHIAHHCDTAWPESAWDYYRQRRQREQEEARLRRVERRDYTVGGGTTEREVVGGSKTSEPERCSSNNVREAKSSDQHEESASEPSANKKPRLEKGGRSSSGRQGFLDLDISNAIPLSKGCGSITKAKAGASNAQRHGNWKPLEELCDVATSFSR